VLDRRAFVRRSALSVAGVSSLSGLLAACGSSGGGATTGAAAFNGHPPSAPAGTFNAALSTDIITLDPAQALTAGDLAVLTQIYEGLLGFNPSYSGLVPALATGYEQSSDGLEWTFDLRSGVKFHDGEAFDSSAVKASFEYYQSKPTFLGPDLLPTKVRGIDVSDPLKVRLMLSEPYPDLAINQTIVRMISPKAIKDKNVAKAPTGTGAYKFVSYAAGQGVHLGAFREHWGDGPYFEKLNLPLVAQLSARVSALSTGQIDIVNRLPPPQAKQLAGNANITELPTKSWASGYVVMVTTNPVLADVRVRQAVAHAIDRQSIVDKILLGRATVADSSLPPGVYGYARPQTQYVYDPAKARELLQAAGLTKPTLRVVAAANVHVLGEEVGQAITAQLQAAGFDAKLEILEAAIYSADISSPAPKRDLYYNEYFWLTGGPLQLTLDFPKAFCKWSPREYASLRAKMLTTPDGPARLDQLAKIQELIAQQLPWLPMQVHTLTDGLRSDIHGYVEPKDGLLPRYGATFRS
jgi:peptide/nickel transport system substrate-binding protein